MGIKTMLAAAAVLFGVGQANAATTVSYDLWLRYEGTEYDDALIYDSEIGEVLLEGDIGLGENDRGLEGFYDFLSVGSVIRFVATVVYPDPPYEWIEQYDNGGTTYACSIGGFSCDGASETYPGENLLRIHYDDHADLTGSTKMGGKITHGFWGLYYRQKDWDEPLRWEYDFQTAHFTVVDAPGPAPVPLPATAALLPLGLGALAVIRRRRRG